MDPDRLFFRNFFVPTFYYHCSQAGHAARGSQDDNITPGSRGTGNSISQEETVSRMGAPRIQDVMLK